MLGFLKSFQRRKSRAAGLLEASRAGVERALEALPNAGLADTLLDLASHTGVDFSELVERARERASDLATRAGESAGELVHGQGAHEISDRARSRAAELAMRAGAAGIGSALAPRKRRSRLPLIVGLAAGVAVGGVLAYFLAPRQGAALRARLLGQAPPEPAIEPIIEPAFQDETVVVVVESPAAASGTSLREMPRAAAARVTTPVQNAMDAIRLRYRQAREAARRTQEETARELWREYSEDVQHRPPGSLAPPLEPNLLPPSS